MEVDEVLAPLSMCRSTVPLNGSSEAGCDDAGSGLTKTRSLSAYMFVLVFAHMLHGVGATPIYTLAVTYLDDNLKAKVTPLYLGEYAYKVGFLYNGPARFTISEVAVDWQESVVLQRKLRPSNCMR